MLEAFVLPEAQADPAEIAKPSLSRLIINEVDFVFNKLIFIIPALVIMVCEHMLDRVQIQ